MPFLIHTFFKRSVSGVIRIMTTARRSQTIGSTIVRISPFARPPSNSDPRPVDSDFAGTTKKGKQPAVFVHFSKPVDFVEITSRRSNKNNNKFIAYDKNGKELVRVLFPNGSRRFAKDARNNKASLSAKGIHKIELRPAAKEEHIFYGDLRFREEPVAIEKIPIKDLPPDVDETSVPRVPKDVVIQIPLQIRNLSVPEGKQLSLVVLFDNKPAIPLFNRELDEADSALIVRPMPIDMEQAIENIAQEFSSVVVNNFFDDSRILKTVLNFGDNFQTLLANWMRDPNNVEDHSILVKLYRPLPVNINTKELVWIDRELSPTWTDSLFVTVAPEQEIIFFLRPPNKSPAAALQLFGREVSNVTMETLLPSGSVQTSGSHALVLEDSTLRRFFTTDIAGIELNVDYTDYNNFVHFSSAENRLVAFREKLLQIEAISSSLVLQTNAASASLAASSHPTGSGTLIDVSGTAQFAAMTVLVEDREDIIRGMDGYERFLFYESGSFSGSLTGLPEDEQLDISDVSWPKASGTVDPVESSASLAYFDNQSVIAADYDASNQEMLRNNVPLYLQNDDESVGFLTFLNMVGHLWDTIKLYIDDMPVIYDRDPSPDRGIPNDLLWHIASSMGINLPNQYSIKELVDFTVGNASSTQATYKQAISETWKRFIHNQIFIAKTKGTRTGLNALLNTYGVLPEIVRVRETATPSPIFTTGSFETFNELTRVIEFASGSSVTLPWLDTGLFSPTTIECRFGMATGTGSFVATTIMHSQTGSAVSWSLVLVPTGSEVNDRGQLLLLDSAGATVAASDVDKFYNGDFYSLMLRQASESSSVDFQVKRFDEDVFEFDFETAVTTSFTSSFRSGEITIGALGAFADGTSSNDIRIDEFRLWNELTTDETFAFHAQFPGMYAGNDNESANDSLIFRHSFGIPQDLSATSSLLNESPFTAGSGLTSASAAGFASSPTFPHQYTRIERETKRFTPNAGGSQFSSAKITIAPSASFRDDSLIITGSSVIPVLSRERSSIKTMMDRADDIKADNRVGLYFTLAETINDSILRSIGTVDINDLIGDPENVFKEQYPDLINLNAFYKRNYAPVFDQNGFIRSVENLLDGLFDHAQQLIPVGTNLVTGIVVEPTILERSKVTLNEPLGLEGPGTRTEENARQILAASGSYPSTRNVDMHVMDATSSIEAEDATLLTLIDNPEIPVEAFLTPLLADIMAETASLLASPEFVNTELPLNDFLSVFATNPQAEDSISLDDSHNVIVLLDLLRGRVVLSESICLEATVPTSDMIIDADIVFTNITAAIEGDFNIPEIKSASDLDDIRNTTFFHLASGSVALVGFEKVRIRENVLNDRGDWVFGDTYSENDVAIVSGSQFRSLTSTTLAPNGTVVNFVSYISPDKQPLNWAPVAFRNIIVPRLFKAVVSGPSQVGTGSVAIVPFNQPGGVFIGYGPNHYRFSRPTYTAYVNARYFGVKQTIDTTVDGKSPIEVLLSSDQQLFVKDGTPSQTPFDESGPILEVRPDEPDST